MAPPPNPRTRASQPAIPAGRTSEPAVGREGAARRAVPDKREAILAAALSLFVERGFWGTAVPEIAERAGVGAGTIYRYFESKEALVNAIYREQKLRFGAAVLENFPPHANTREQFRTIWMRMARFATDNPDAFIFLELHHHASYLDAESRVVEQRMLDVITQVVTAAQARHELKQGPPHLLMGLIMGSFVGVSRSCLGDRPPPTEAEWAFVEQCAWEAVRG